MTIATDLYAPRITATKTVNSPTANLGQTLTYTVNVQNTGQDAAIETRFSDLIPAGAVFVPGSITLGGVPLTDAPGDDLGEFAGGQVVVRLGTLAAASVHTRSRRERNSELPGHGRHGGAGSWARRSRTPRISRSEPPRREFASTVTTAPAITNVNVPDLAIGKTHAPALTPGGRSTYTITVGNVGAGPTSGLVTVTDTLVPELTRVGPVTAPGWDCSTSSGQTITCARSDPLAAGSDYPPISFAVLVSARSPAWANQQHGLPYGGE